MGRIVVDIPIDRRRAGTIRVDAMSFNDTNTAECEVLPSGVSGIDLVEWTTTIGGYDIHGSGGNPTFTLPPVNWPASNSAWGGGKTLTAQIPSSAFLHSVWQNLPLSTSEGYAAFLDKEGTEADGTAPNWYVYWRQTSANSGTMYWDRAPRDHKLAWPLRPH